MKIIAVLPAYNAQKTIEKFIRSIPKGIINEIVVVDDASTDNTYQAVKGIRGISAYRNARNLGYGGNLKMCLGIALDHGADVIVELHPDGEYGTDGIAPALKKVRDGAQLALGNRFTGTPKGMYWQKYVITRLLTGLDNLAFGTRIPDMHQGFRVYTRTLLKTIDYRSLHNDYLFSFQIIAAAVAQKLRIDWVPVSAQYAGKKRGASWRASIKYAVGTFEVLLRQRRSNNAKSKLPVCPICHQSYLVTHRLRLGTFDLWFCDACQIGFTDPQPDDLGKYYAHAYWFAPGILGVGKALVFRLAQKRRLSWILRYYKKGSVLDVGAGMGIFGKELTRLGFDVTSIDAPFASLADPNIQLIDFINWKTKKRFNAIVFWESFEHIPDPAAYLAKAKSLLAPHGHLFIEYPRYSCLESRVFGQSWYDLDIPRHLFHFTVRGMGQLLAKNGLATIRHEGIMAFDYAPWGCAQSLLSWLLHEPPFLERRDMSVLRLFLLVPFLVVSELLEIGLFLFGQSPIQLVVAEKS